jgi:hypothetical protein
MIVFTPDIQRAKNRAYGRDQVANEKDHALFALAQA